MPKGRSYSTDQWDSFQKGGHTFITEDFAHDKTLVFKTKLEKVIVDGQKTNTVSGVNLKESFSEKPQGLSGSGEAKFWYNIWDKRSMYVKVGTNSNLFVHYDHGVGQVKGLNHNFYCSVESNRSFTQKIGTVGIQFFKDKFWSFNSKFVYDFTKKNISWAYKTYYAKGSFKYNTYTSVDITHAVLSKTGFLLSWVPPTNQNEEKWKHSYFLRLENNKRAETVNFRHFLQNIYVNWNIQVSSTHNIGLQSRFTLRKLSSDQKNWIPTLDSLWLASEWKFADSIVKAKVSKDLTSALTVKNKLAAYGSYSLGVQASELGTKNRFKFGVQIDLNV